MFGEGISLLDLTQLLKAIREKDLVLQVKIIDDEWQDLNKNAIHKILNSIIGNRVNKTNDIRMRLYSGK